MTLTSPPHVFSAHEAAEHPPSKEHQTNHLPASFYVAAAIGTASAVGMVVALQNPKHPYFQNALNLLFLNPFSPPRGLLSLADGSAPVVESKTRVSFPSTWFLVMKNIDVHASDCLYTKMSSRSVCTAFEESDGSGSENFGGDFPLRSYQRYRQSDLASEQKR